MQQFLTSMLSISIKIWKGHFKICWAYLSWSDAYPERAHQDLLRSHALAEHMWRNWCIPWAYASVSNVYAQHKRKNSKFEKVPSNHAEHGCKELMLALSVRVRNWCVLQVYASGTDTYPDHQFLTCMLSISIKIPILKRSLHNVLSMRVRNWCPRSACASEIKWCLVPQKI